MQLKAVGFPMVVPREQTQFELPVGNWAIGGSDSFYLFDLPLIRSILIVDTGNIIFIDFIVGDNINWLLNDTGSWGLGLKLTGESDPSGHL